MKFDFFWFWVHGFDFFGFKLLIFLGSWVWLFAKKINKRKENIDYFNFLGKFSSSFPKNMKNSSGFTCIVLGLLLILGFISLFFWIWWRLDLVTGFGFGFAKDWIDSWVYFLNLRRTWRTCWYVLMEKKIMEVIIIIIIILLLLLDLRPK